MRMRLTFREEPFIKSVAYTGVCIFLMLFSYSFLPVLGIFKNTPVLLVSAVACLAFFEDVRYAAFFALVFSVVETVILGTNPLIFPLFYTAYAIFCVWMFENFFAKNFLAFLGYTAAGLLAHSLLSLFAPVGNWNITAKDIVVEKTVPTLVMSFALSLLLYPLFKRIKRKTDRN